MNAHDLINSARQRLDAARPALGTVRSIDLGRMLDDLEAAISSAANARQRIDADANLSGKGKAAKRAEARRAYEAAALRITNRVMETVSGAEREQRDRLRVPPPEGPDAALRMLTARQDAIMVLDRVAPTEVGRAMQTLARDRGDVGRLLLTDWSSKYLMARGDNISAADWHATRDQLAAEWIGDAGRAALEALAVMPEATKAAETVTFAARTAADAIGPADLAPHPDAPAWPTQGEYTASVAWSSDDAAAGHAGASDG